MQHPSKTRFIARQLAWLSIPATLGTPALTLAQSDQRATAIEEVVVAARRVEESLQDVPVAITALTRNDLEALRVDSILGVGQTVPNVYIQKQGGSTAPQINMRGVSNGSLNLQVDSGIGMYVDGVYMGRGGAATFEMADLERVEVMRGPQGTLFGRNSTGGAINMITASPSGEFGVRLDTGFGNFNERHYKATIDLPEWHGLATRLTVGNRSYDGDVKNLSPRRTWFLPEPFGKLTTSRRGGDSDSDNLFFAAEYNGIERLKVAYKFDYSDWEGTQNYRQMGSFGPCVSFDATPGQCIIGSGLVDAITPIDESFSYRDRLAMPLESAASNEVLGHSLTVDFELSDSVDLRYILGYREYELDMGSNQVWGGGEYIDTAGLVGGRPGATYTPMIAMRYEEHEQTSHELQLLGNVGNVDWIVGVFHFSEEGEKDGPILLSPTIADGQFVPISAEAFHYFVGQKLATDNTSTAVYGHLNWRINDLELAGGLRYTEDEREEFIVAAGLYGLFLPGNQSFKYDGDNVDYDVSATWHVSDSTNVYAKHATGFVSGGILGGSTFEQEDMKLYELGVKGDLLDRSLRLNAAVFRQERSDVQIEGFTAVGYFMGKGRDIVSEGLELEATWLPTAGLKLNAAWGYTNVDSSGDLRTYQPEHTLYLGMGYEFATLASGIQPSLRIDANWRDDVYRLACPAGMDQVPASDICLGMADPALDATARIRAHTRLNARFELAEIPLAGDTRMKAALWGRNLLDEDEIEFNFTLGGPTITNTFMRPRTYGLDLSVEF